MSYQVIARKWRPQTFNDLVGQKHVTETLANAIRTIAWRMPIFFRARAAWEKLPRRAFWRKR